MVIYVIKRFLIKRKLRNEGKNHELGVSVFSFYLPVGCPILLACTPPWRREESLFSPHHGLVASVLRRPVTGCDEKGSLRQWLPRVAQLSLVRWVLSVSTSENAREGFVKSKCKSMKVGGFFPKQAFV